MTPSQFAWVLRMTESGGNPRAYGDDGLALTAYQVHPAWVWDHGFEAGIKPGVNYSWDRWVSYCVQGFFARRSGYRPAVEIAMEFHLGHPSSPDAADWDSTYANLFNHFAARIPEGV